MNEEQVKTGIRQVLTGFGGVLIGLGIASAADWAAIMGKIEPFIGLASVIGSVIWGQYVRRRAGLIVSALKVDPVEQVTISEPKLAAEVAAKAPPNTRVVQS